MRYHKTLISLALSAMSIASAARAQHVDVLVQRQGNKLYTGVADNEEFSWTMGARVFARDFDSDYWIDTPGYSALAATSSAMPSGYSSLPASSALSWDFLPMQNLAAVSNLMFWDGADVDSDGLDLDDVMFVPASGHALSLQGTTGTAIADATNQLIQGYSLGNTGSNGSLHIHRSYRLSNDEPGLLPVDGIYLAALQLRMSGQESSDPVFLVFGTPGSALVARNAAAQWVYERVDLLTNLSLPGDFNADGQVDSADYTVWRDSFNQQGTALPADGNGDQIVDAADYGIWKQHFGVQLATGFASGQGSSNIIAPITSLVPEPTTTAILYGAALLTLVTRKRSYPRKPPHA